MKTPEHRYVPKLPLRPPIRRRSGLGLVVVVVARDTLPALALAPAHSLAYLPSAGAAGVVARADMDSARAVMRDVPVAAAAAVVGDKADTRSAEVAVAACCHIHVGQGYCSGSIRSQCQQEVGQGQWDLRLHAH